MLWYFLILCIVLLFYNYLRNKRNREFWKHIMAIPGPPAYPFIGTEYKLGTSEEVFIRYRLLGKKYFPIYKTHSFNTAAVCLMHPEDIEMVLNNPKHIEKSKLYDLISDWLGSGLVLAKGEQWYKKRKILTPALHFSILQKFVTIFNNEVSHMVNDFKKICHRPYIEIKEPISYFTLYSIGETSFGTKLRNDPMCSKYVKAVHDHADQFVYRLIRPWLHNPFIYKLTKEGKNNRKTVDTLHAFSNKILKEKYSNIERNENSSFPGKDKMALLDILIKYKNDGADINDLEIREEVDTFILGGHDTTAIALSHILLILANEEEIQDKIYSEMVSTVENLSNPSYAELGNLKFMEMCIKEGLRRYSSITIISRLAGEEIKTKSGYTIPKGCNIRLLLYDMHMNPRIYENPEKFDPDRFLPENIAKRHPYAFVPFSAGRRNCIGQRYAMLEMKAALCGILKEFKLKSVTKPSELRHKVDIVLKLASEIRIKFVLRK